MTGGVWLVSREIDGVAEAGGLKDVVRGLADALVDRGVETTVVIPRYAFLSDLPIRPLFSFELPISDVDRHITIGEIRQGTLRILLVEEPSISAKRAVYTYTSEDVPPGSRIGEGHVDVHEINLIHQRGALESAFRLGIAPGVVHGHDGHCGFLPALMRRSERYRRFFARTGVLTTIHNAGREYQQEISDINRAVAVSGLPASDLQAGEIDGRINPLLLAGRYGHLNTVSPGYAREIRNGNAGEAEPLGGWFRREEIPLPGITNGLDPLSWVNDAAADLANPEEKARRRRAFMADLYAVKADEKGPDQFGPNPDPRIPWLLFHGRLTHQKGARYFADAVEILKKEGPDPEFGAVVLGQGEREIEETMRSRAEKGNMTFYRGYRQEMARQLFMASSFVALPSIWEPCGITDMIGQLTGALPVSRAVGGLTKVRDHKTGFLYLPADADALAKTLKKALIWERKFPARLRRMRRRAEKEVYERRSWKKILVRGYFPLYHRCRERIG